MENGPNMTKLGVRLAVVYLSRKLTNCRFYGRTATELCLHTKQTNFITQNHSKFDCSVGRMWAISAVQIGTFAEENTQPYKRVSWVEMRVSWVRHLALCSVFANYEQQMRSKIFSMPIFKYKLLLRIPKTFVLQWYQISFHYYKYFAS